MGDSVVSYVVWVDSVDIHWSDPRDSYLPVGHWVKCVVIGEENDGPKTDAPMPVPDEVAVAPI